MKKQNLKIEVDALNQAVKDISDDYDAAERKARSAVKECDRLQRDLAFYKRLSEQLEWKLIQEIRARVAQSVPAYRGDGVRSPVHHPESADTHAVQYGETARESQ